MKNGRILIASIVIFTLFVTLVLILVQGNFLGDLRRFSPNYSDSIKEGDEEVCIQVITQAINPDTGEMQEFSTPCDVPEGWETVDSTTGTMLIDQSGNAIAVFPQKPGPSILVTTVQIARDGYIVIHTAQGEEIEGVVTASELMSAGAYPDVVINMPTPTLDGQEFAAMLHEDNGDGVFNLDEDPPLLDSQGNPVHGFFMISTEAEEFPEVVF